MLCTWFLLNIKYKHYVNSIGMRKHVYEKEFVILIVHLLILPAACFYIMVPLDTSYSILYISAILVPRNL